MTIKQRLTAIWQAAQGKKPEASGGYATGSGYTIDDGVDWSGGVYSPTPKQPTTLQEAPWHQVEFDQPHAGNAAEKVGLPVYNLLREWDWRTRYDIITRCHQVWERNPLAKAAVNLTRQFAVSTGVTVSTRAVEVKEVIDAFMKESKANVIDKGMCDSLQLDGEVFVRLFNRGGKTVIRFVKPWDVQGIETEQDDTQTITGYSLADGKTVKPDEIVHVKINALPYELRGRPELVPVLAWLKAYKDWLEDRFRQNRRRSAAWDVTLKSATAAQVTAKRSQYREPPPPGSILVHNENEVWQAIEQKIAAGDVAEDGRQFKLMVAVGVNLPEFMLGSGSDANLATAQAQGLPALMKFKDFQDVMKEMWLAVLRAVIEHAVAGGLVPEECVQVDGDGDPIKDKDGKPKMVKALDAFDVQYPALTESDPKTLAEALQIDVANGWCANATAASKRGYDPLVEKKKIVEEQAEAQAMQAAQQPEVPEEQPEDEPPEGEVQPEEQAQDEEKPLLRVRGNKAETIEKKPKEGA